MGPAFVAAFASPASARPPAGRAVDETIVVALAPLRPGPCVSTTFGTVTVVVGRAALDTLAAVAMAGRSWRTEDERLRRIAGDRAAALLAASTSATDPRGCAVVPQESLGDALYLVGDLLERGAATVFRAGASSPERTVQVRYLAIRCGPRCGHGSILFAIPDGDASKPFMSMSWWVA